MVPVLGILAATLLFLLFVLTSRHAENLGEAGSAALVAGAAPQGLSQVVFIRNFLQEDADVDEVRLIARRAAGHGFTAVLFSSSFDNIAWQPPEFFARLTEVKATLDSLGLDVIPRVTSAGWAYRALAHDRDFAAALPVRNALFVVDGPTARHVADSKPVIRNGDFEAFAGHRAEGFRIQDGGGSVSFVDDSVAKEGRASLRFEDLGNSKGGLGRVMQRVAVEPFRCYRVSFWVKSEDLDHSEQVRGLVRTDDGRTLMEQSANLKRTEGWRQVTLGFNSLDYDEVLIYAGLWGGSGGRLWLDDLRIDEVGMVNVLRRAGTPFTVRGESSGVVYEEGRDYRRIVDPRLNFLMNHDGPDIELTAQSRIADSERLRVDFYQAFAIKGQIAACLSEDRVYELWRESIELVKEHLSPKWYHLGFDEVRQGGWCAACEQRGMSCGEMLAAAITRMTDVVADVDPAAEVIVWSDMLDPNHNANKRDFLSKDSFAGSWENVPRAVIVACWNYDTRLASLRHFSSLGHRTLAAAYYDADSIRAMEENASGWLDALAEVDGGMGIMYTTWREKYESLEAFGDFIVRRRSGR